MSKKQVWYNELLTQDVLLLYANPTRVLTELSVRGVGASILQPRLRASATSHFFGPLKQQLSGKHLDTDRNVRREVRRAGYQS
jgi:hypothetical protein